MGHEQVDSDFELVVPEEDLALLPEGVGEWWGPAIHQYSLGGGSQSLRVMFDAIIAGQKELAVAKERIYQLGEGARMAGCTKSNAQNTRVEDYD